MSDNHLSLLRIQGYSVVVTPKSNLKPTDTLDFFQNALHSRGALDSIMNPGGAPLPPIVPTPEGATITGQTDRDLSLGVGATILGQILGAISGGTVNLKAAYSKAKALKFTYEDVIEEKVDIDLLDKFLDQADLDPGPSAEAIMAANNLYVIISTLKSDKISVEATDETGAGLEVDLPVVKKVLGANLDAKYKRGSKSTVTYSKDGQPVVFAIKAIRMIFESDDGGLDYLRLERIPSESVIMKHGGALREIPGTTPQPPKPLPDLSRGQVRGYNHLALSRPFVRIA